MDEKMKEKIRECMEQIHLERDRGVVRDCRDATCFASGYLAIVSGAGGIPVGARQD